MPADSKVVKFDADVSGYIKGIKDSQKAGEDFERSIKKNIGTLQGAVLSLDLYKNALKAAAEQIAAVINKQVELQKQGGSRTIDMATSLISLGVKDVSGAIKSITDAKGPTTLDQRAAFLAKRASAQGGMGNQRVRGADAVNSVLNYSEGGDLQYGAGGEDYNTLLDRFGDSRRADQYIKGNGRGGRGDTSIYGRSNDALGNEIYLRSDEAQKQGEAEGRAASSGANIRNARNANEAAIDRGMRSESGLERATAGANSFAPQWVRDLQDAYHARHGTDLNGNRLPSLTDAHAAQQEAAAAMQQAANNLERATRPNGPSAKIGE